MEAIAFYLFLALTISMFFVVITSKNALYAMSALAGGMIFIAVPIVNFPLSVLKIISLSLLSKYSI